MAVPPFKVKAVYDYASAHEDDLNFPNGQVITVTELEGDDWYVGEYLDAAGSKHEGLFPANFVEKFEPAAPPRPTRTRAKKDTLVAESTADLDSVQIQDITNPPEPKSTIPGSEKLIHEESTATITPVRDIPNPTRSKKDIVKAEPSPPEITKSNSAEKAPKPAPIEKPSSFKDRIAAFNKGAQAPLAPVKPGAPPSTSFVKKPFVAPPPSRNAYVPPPKPEIPQSRVYRREEDPEILEQQAQDLKDAERAGLVPTDNSQDAEEAPKQTSLKERIALLQKQQQEAAARRVEAAHKDKPKRPAKKVSGLDEESVTVFDNETVPLERTLSPESVVERKSTDSKHDIPVSVPTSTAQRQAPREIKPPESHARDIASDGNDADQSGAGETTEEAEGTSTEVEEEDERRARSFPRTTTGLSSHTEHDRKADNEEEEDEVEGGRDDQAEEAEEIDPEVRRRMELTARMAKMSGGYGMPNMFGMPGMMPMGGGSAKKSKPGISPETESTLDQISSEFTQRVPVIPVVGGRKGTNDEHEHASPIEREPESLSISAKRRTLDLMPDDDDENLGKNEHPSERPDPQERPNPLSPIQRGAPPPVPGGRPIPPAVETRPPPPPPSGPRAVLSPSPGSESDDESSELPQPPQVPQHTAPLIQPSRGPAPPVPTSPPTSQRPEGPRSSVVIPSARYSASLPEPALSSPTSISDKRASKIPPIPSGPPMTAIQPDARPPPPPPPSTVAPPKRQSTLTESLNKGPASSLHGNDGESEYEGDYDTDIASAAPRKDALKAHAREPSLDEGTLSDNAALQLPTENPPPLPPTTTRPAPPPPPHQPPKITRQSIDINRAPPPIPSSARDPEDPTESDDYDPYRYHEQKTSLPTPTADKIVQESDPALYATSPPPQRRVDHPPPLPPQSPPQKHTAPPPLPPQHQTLPPTQLDPRPSRELPRRSVEVPRSSVTISRASTDLSRVPGEQGQMAQEIDLAEASQWWARPDTRPPAFQGRADILVEFEESTTSKRGGRTTVSKDAYILFPDYSQTVITARFDAKDPSDVTLEQRHEPPPARLRQEQLEDAHRRLGSLLSPAATAKQNQTVGDGTAQAFILEMLRGLPSGAAPLMPVGTRSYGALVYANMANATVQQYDEIRPGDIISFRNAKFQGKHGAMHSKYSEEVGKPEHVGVVLDWDGTKKKVRALEQGREGQKKVKIESFRVGDLRSGEVKVWRVMERVWVGWEGGS